MEKLSILLGNLLVKYILPFLFKETQELIESWGEARKVKRAYLESTKEAQTKFDADMAKPGITAKEKANAIRALLSAHPNL